MWFCPKAFAISMSPSAEKANEVRMAADASIGYTGRTCDLTL